MTRAATTDKPSQAGQTARSRSPSTTPPTAKYNQAGSVLVHRLAEDARRDSVANPANIDELAQLAASYLSAEQVQLIVEHAEPAELGVVVRERLVPQPVQQFVAIRGIQHVAHFVGFCWRTVRQPQREQMEIMIAEKKLTTLEFSVELAAQAQGKS